MSSPFPFPRLGRPLRLSFPCVPVRPLVSAGLTGYSLCWLGLAAASAAPTVVWTLGQDEDPYSSGYAPTNEFSQENYANDAAPGLVTRLPGDPLYNASTNPARDDHYYFAGTYPAGFNGLAAPLTVPNAEPATAFERALHNSDVSNRIHFMLDAAQAGPQSRLRLSFDIIDGGIWFNAPINRSGHGFGTHNIQVRFRTATTNVLLLDRQGLDRDTRFTIDFPAGAAGAVAGANTIEITRTGPAPASGSSTWVQFDFVQLEAETDALADGDNDGLPRWWELDNHLDDSLAADATSDRDGDGLSASQEYHGGNLPSDPNRADSDGDGANDTAERTAGSNPLQADTDGDGLSDGSEISATPASSPLLADTDSDGAPDPWERRVGSNPASAASLPAAATGCIGINFVSSSDAAGALPWFAPAGVVPQIRWNNTTQLNTWDNPSGSTTDIVSPTPAAVACGTGATVPGMAVSWTSENSSASGNAGSPDARLLNGYLRASGTTPATLTLTGIPFGSYHVFAYVGGSYDGQRGTVGITGDPATTRQFTCNTTAPQSELVEIKPTAAIPWPEGNFARFANRSGGTLTLVVNNSDGWSVGLHGVQIVDATLDADASGIPDWFEFQHALQPAGPATASADPDGDGLSNLQEFQRGSNPRAADTDGDGLADGAESAANALAADSDGDGLSDRDEASAAIPTNPNLADSDGDGRDDKTESQLGLDPTENTAATPGFTGWVPAYSAAPDRWEWKLDNVQLVWDHGAGATGGDNGTTDTLLGFSVINQGSGAWRSLVMQLRTEANALSYYFESDNGSAFSAAGNPVGGFNLEDPNNPPADLKAALGFSGYGANDISDRLGFRLHATRGTGNSWSLVFEIHNLTRNTTAISRTVGNSTAAANVDDGTALWQGSGDSPGFPHIELHQGARLFISSTPLENRAAFAAARDSDNDGMPDVWEDLYVLNKNLAADATGDADGDGLRNRDEWLAGTNPRLPDSDGDGVDDRSEREQSGNPLDAAIRPAFAGTSVPSGTDFNHNNLPDAWEAKFHATGIAPHIDSDGDGASNGQEAYWGTDPFDPRSRVAVALQRDANDAVVTWTEQPWKRQRLYRSTNLGSWQWLSNPAFSDGGTQTTRLAGQFSSSASAFFRVETKDRDSDGDGVADWDESFAGSDPYRRDSTRRDAPIFDTEGNVLGSVSGDYASFAQNLQGALPGSATSQVTRAQAARFLQQSTFGPTRADLDRVQKLGLAAWIEDQIHNQPATLHASYIRGILADVRGPRLDLTYTYNADNSTVGGENTSTAFARAAIAGPDQLRQRVAFALSQILVTSRRDANLANRPLGMADYYDIFVRNAFGNYRDILREVSLHPAMGRYLSHVGNQKARPEINQFPDENYARELMQLFTIGLWELNPDGSRKTTPAGAFIPTYGNADITEFARIFTGLWFGGQSWGDGGGNDADYTVPMQMWAEKHDYGVKSLLNGYVVPARAPDTANGLRDIDDALGHLFNHPNTGVFIGRQLIQFLVTSNPSPAYVTRVSAVFADNGGGKRGDLGAVVAAILLDEEARDARWSHGDMAFGRLKEPVFRAMAVARAARLDRFSNLLWWDYGNFYEDAFQQPGYSPSVFNFYRPDYRPPGLLTQNQLAAPAFQITDSYTSIAFVNRLWATATDGLRLYDTYRFQPDYRDLLALANDPPALVDEANLLFCGGMMTSTTRDTILNALTQAPSADALLRVQLAVFLCSTCPEGAIQR